VPRTRITPPFIVIAAAALIYGAAGAARAATPGCAAAGPIPAAFPARLLIGINAPSADDTWAAQSGTRWDVQWSYLSGQAGNNWYNGYGGSPADGSWIKGYFQAIDANGFIPGIHLYNMGFGHDRGDAGILQEVQDPAWSKEYFTEWKALMTRAKAFGKPVVIVIEGDSFGFLENLTQNDPTVAAAVASTGLPELAALPDTVAGFALAYLAIRKSVGAYNVAMGPDTPYYAANGDIMNFPPADTDDLQPHIDFQWTFFGAFVGANATGDRFDFTASCPDAADCAYYTDGRPCWDPSDAASVDAPSINRYAAWLQLFNQRSGVRWMLHQVPLGNSQHKNIPFDGSPRSGYQDNRAEYLFQYESPASTAIRDAHLAKLADAGVMGLLFGSSDDGDTPATDIWKDGQPFLATHVAAVNNNGGFTVARGDTGCSASAGSGGATGAAGANGGAGGTSGGAGGARAGAGGTGASVGGTTGAATGTGAGGCGCRVGGADATQGIAAIAAAALALGALVRRRRPGPG
jgi:MYXO-CTERM domain-containing protein